MKTDSIYKIILVDDHTLFTQSLKFLLNSFENFEVVNTFENGKLFVDFLDSNPTFEADLVLLDVNMPILDGIQTMKWVGKNRPSQKVLALSLNDDEDTIIKMLKNGARGYLLKDTSPNMFEEAMTIVIESGIYYTELVSGILVNRYDKIKNKIQLRDKEIEFVKLCCTEKTYKEIAEVMHISPKTVEGYREEIFSKLELKSRIGLVLYAIKNKIYSV